jgi:hypothetical protein
MAEGTEYTNETYVFAGAFTIVVGTGMEFVMADTVFPAEATPYWKVTFYRSDSSSFIVYSSTLTVMGD